MPDETTSGGERGLYKSFLDHVEDLRKMLIRMAFAIVIGMGISFAYTKEIFSLFLAPLATVPEISDPRKFLQSLGVADSFTLTLQIAFYGGLVISSPFLLFFIGQFILPALTPKEKGYFYPGLLIAVILFAIGFCFAYFWLLPMGLQFFLRDASEMGIVSNWSVTEYISFVTNFVIAFGLAFELPLVVLVLNRLGILPARILSSGRRFAIVIIMIFAAVITPTGDAFTLMAMAVPLVLLYEICIWIAYAMERRKAAADEAS